MADSVDDTVNDTPTDPAPRRVTTSGLHASGLDDSADIPELREALAALAASVVVVTATVDGVPVGFTATSFTSVSMDPPLVGVLLADSAASYDAFCRARTVAFNFLGEHQAEVAGRFATRGAEKFAELALDPCLEQGLDAAPVLADTMVTLVGEVTERVVLGDHVLLLATPRVVTPVRHEPLLYHRRSFRRLEA
ncbi:flavin reductase family protein [Nocardioides sp. DS6]|uniref:Flavin reductase family protein n=1 Tax=Nocardioides eburneus TaxID=3231482 RepID=A0ABV3T051_9ACTN